jgi:hypothetical protein
VHGSGVAPGLHSHTVGLAEAEPADPAAAAANAATSATVPRAVFNMSLSSLCG